MATPMITFTKTLTLAELATEPEPPSQMRMMAMAASEPEPPPDFWALLPQAVNELVSEMQAAGVEATGEWIRSSIHRVGSTADTVSAYGILPAGAPARFTGGPLDGTAQPSEAEPSGDYRPRLTRPDGSYYELSAIDYQACEYIYVWHPVEAEPFTWT